MCSACSALCGSARSSFLCARADLAAQTSIYLVLREDSLVQLLHRHGRGSSSAGSCLQHAYHVACSLCYMQELALCPLLCLRIFASSSEHAIECQTSPGLLQLLRGHRRRSPAAYCMQQADHFVCSACSMLRVAGHLLLCLRRPGSSGEHAFDCLPSLTHSRCGVTGTGALPRAARRLGFVLCPLWVVGSWAPSSLSAQTWQLRQAYL